MIAKDEPSIEIISARGRESDFIGLVREYTDWVMSCTDIAADVFASQSLDKELEDVSVKFGGEKSNMYLALVEGKVAGCVAVAESPSSICEIKRLYVRPDFRGMGLSNKLASRAIDDAKNFGYTTMRLDTFAWMKAAIALYEKLGFKKITRYNDNMADDAVFMELSLL